MYRKLLPLALVAGLGAAGCAADTEAAGSGDDKLKVGVLFPGSLSDDGFMESGYLGYQRIEKELGDEVELTKVEQVPATDYEQALARLSSDADLVVSLGGQTDAVVRKLAPTFPDVKFVEIGGPADAEPLANLAYYDPKQADGGFLAGAYAALVTKTGKVAFVGGMELPAIVKTADQFAQGAKHVKPGVTVLKPQYVGDFNDVAGSKQATQADAGAGADVFGQQLNLGRRGMAQAAGAAGASVIGGPIVKKCGSEPGFVGYVKSDTGAELEYAVKAALDGTWKAEQVSFGIGSDTGASDLVLCGASPEVTKKITQIKKDIASGAIKIP